MAGSRRRVVLVRHGETEWSRTGRHTGNTDVELTETGRRQALDVAERLAGRTFTTVLSSPLARARATAELAGFGGAVELDDDLREWAYGEYEGTTTPEIREHVPDWTVWSGPVPGGEDATSVGRRADRVIERLLATDEGDAVVFGHGHALRVLGARWVGLRPEDGRLLKLGPATVSVLGHEREQRALEAWNDGAYARGTD